jgi:NitT/TauT family transport system permease protein
MTMWQLLKPRTANLRLWQAGLLAAVVGFWYLMTTPGLVPNFMFDNDRQAAFFFGEPVKVAQRIWVWFVAEADIYRHLAVTLVETCWPSAWDRCWGWAPASGWP